MKNQNVRDAGDVEYQMNTKKLTYKYNDKENLKEIRKIWDDIFNDTVGFTNYYFNVVCKENRVFTVCDNNKVIGMIHCNPYKILVNNTPEDAVYIVGVAVLPEYREKGIMKEMLKCALKDMKSRGIKLAFLMPENENYYIGSGFSKVISNYDYKIIIPTHEIEQNIITTVSVERMNDKEKNDLTVKINNYLDSKYDIFCERNSNYFDKIVAEAQAQNGNTEILVRQNEIICFFSYCIYDGCMYIERFIIFNNNDADFIIGFIISKAKKLKCDCIKMINISDNAALLESVLNLNNICYEKKNGKGYMVYNFFNNNYHKNRQKKYYYDEIV